MVGRASDPGVMVRALNDLFKAVSNAAPPQVSTVTKVLVLFK
jgi:hypothetical protein